MEHSLHCCLLTKKEGGRSRMLVQSPQKNIYSINNLIKFFIKWSYNKIMTKTKLRLTYISSAKGNSAVKSFKF